MKRNIKLLSSMTIASILASTPLTSFSMGKSDDPWLTKVMGETEILKEGDENVVEWEVDAWLGRDLSKFWIKTEGEYEVSSDESELESAQVDLVYSKAVSAYWDVQFGVRHDFKPEFEGDTRSWLVLGYTGTAPSFWNVDANLYVGEESSIQLDVELEKEYMVTQKWVLIQEVNLTFNGQTNERFEEGSGLSVAEASLRIGYEPIRKFQTFIGVSGKQSFGATKSIEKSEGNKSGNLSLIAGVEFWF